MTIGERCRDLRILVTPLRRGEGPLTTHCCRFQNDNGWAVVVKGFRMPARHRRVGAHGGRRPKSLEGGNRGGSWHRRWCRSMGNLSPLLDLICELRTGRRLSD
jgi:hypothetical protein